MIIVVWLIVFVTFCLFVTLFSCGLCRFDVLDCWFDLVN